MKHSIDRLLVTATCCLGLGIAACSKPRDGSLEGTWRGSDHTGERATFVFEKNSRLGLMGVDNLLIGTWKLNKVADPFQLNLTLPGDTGRNTLVQAILRFLDDDRVQLRFSYDLKQRPDAFDEEDAVNQIELRRVKRRG